jgi:hypothetical protein
MTFLHIRDQGLRKHPEHTLGERRSDHATADKIRDALRARGVQAAAQALAHQHVALDIALRVLAGPARRRADDSAERRQASRRPVRTARMADEDAVTVPA